MERAPTTRLYKNLSETHMKLHMMMLFFSLRIYNNKPANTKMPANSTYAKKRPASSRRAPMKSAKRRTTYAPTVDSDSMNMLVTSYFEASIQQPDQADQATGGTFGYTLKCDPVAMALKRSGNANGAGTVLVNMTDAANTEIADGQTLSFNRLANFLTLYRQYKVNHVKINVTVDRECGLDNALIMLQDKGESTPCVSVGQAMSQAHKAKVLTEADRTMSYGWTAKTASEKEYHTISDQINDVRAQYIKVLQEVEPKLSGKCKHRIEVICSVTLRDSKSGN